jgi:iron(III) transport system substrate-binding protein
MRFPALPLAHRDASGCAISTGVITAKLLAEKANPQADAVMGVAASSLALLDKQGMLIPYAPLNLDAIMSQYRDKKNPPAWFGMDVWGATICFNTVEAQKRNIPKPETWKDLTKPATRARS